MKHFAAATFLFLISVFFISCRMDKPDPLPEGPSYTVKLNIARERTIQEESEPLTMVKGAPYDLYAVQIYKKGLNNNYSKYAYGIFDNEDDMFIELPAGATYKIEMTMVPDGASVIAKGENGGYREPFTTGGFGSGPGKVTNVFTASMSSYINKLNSGYALLNQPTDAPTGYNRPPISRFYGVADNFIPSANTALTIELKWVCFGLTVIPEDFTEGVIEIEMEGASKLTVTPDDPTAITKKIFTFDHSLDSEDWTAPDYSESVPIAITWIKNDGTRVVFRPASTPTTVERKQNKIFRIPCGDGPHSNLTVTKEDEILTDDVEVIARP